MLKTLNLVVIHPSNQSMFGQVDLIVMRERVTHKKYCSVQQMVHLECSIHILLKSRRGELGFFQAYHVRLMVKHQIMIFNEPMETRGNSCAQCVQLELIHYLFQMDSLLKVQKTKLGSKLFKLADEGVFSPCLVSCHAQKMPKTTETPVVEMLQKKLMKVTTLSNKLTKKQIVVGYKVWVCHTVNLHLYYKAVVHTENMCKCIWRYQRWRNNKVGYPLHNNISVLATRVVTQALNHPLDSLWKIRFGFGSFKSETTVAASVVCARL